MLTQDLTKLACVAPTERKSIKIMTKWPNRMNSLQRYFISSPIPSRLRHPSLSPPPWANFNRNSNVCMFFFTFAKIYLFNFRQLSSSSKVSDNILRIEVGKNLCHGPKTFRGAVRVPADFGSKASAAHFCQGFSVECGGKWYSYMRSDDKRKAILQRWNMECAAFPVKASFL